MADSPLGPRRVNRQQRQAAILEDRAEGMTWKEIAAKHERSIRYIRQEAYAAMETLKDRKADLVAQIVQKQVDRLERIMMAFEDDMEAGDPKAAQVILGAIDRLADIKGLKAAVKVVGVDLDPKDVYTTARLLGIPIPGESVTVDESRPLRLIHTAVNVLSGSPETPRGTQEESEHVGAEGLGREREGVGDSGGTGPG